MLHRPPLHTSDSDAAAAGGGAGWYRTRGMSEAAGGGSSYGAASYYGQRRQNPRQDDTERFQRYRRLLMEQELSQRCRREDDAPRPSPHRLEPTSSGSGGVFDAIAKHLLPPTSAPLYERTQQEESSSMERWGPPHLLVTSLRRDSPPYTDTDQHHSSIDIENTERGVETDEGSAVSDWRAAYVAMRNKCGILGTKLVEALKASQKREVDICRRWHRERAEQDAELLQVLSKAESALRENIPDEFSSLLTAQHGELPDTDVPQQLVQLSYRLVTLAQAVSAQRKLDAVRLQAASSDLREKLLPVRQQISDATRVLFQVSRKSDDLASNGSTALPPVPHLSVSRNRAGKAGDADSTSSLLLSSPHPTCHPSSPTTRLPSGQGGKRGASADASIRYVPLDGTPDPLRMSTPTHRKSSTSADGLPGARGGSSRRKRSSSSSPMVNVRDGSLLRELDGTPHDDGPFAKLRERLYQRHGGVTHPAKAQQQSRKETEATPTTVGGTKQTPRSHVSSRSNPSLTVDARSSSTASFDIHYYGHNIGAEPHDHPKTRPSSMTTDNSHGGVHHHRRVAPSMTAAQQSEIQAVCDLLRDAFHTIDVVIEASNGSYHEEGDLVDSLQADLRRITVSSLAQLQRFSSAASSEKKQQAHSVRYVPAPTLRDSQSPSTVDMAEEDSAALRRLSPLDHAEFSQQMFTPNISVGDTRLEIEELTDGEDVHRHRRVLGGQPGKPTHTQTSRGKTKQIGFIPAPSEARDYRELCTSTNVSMASIGSHARRVVISPMLDE